MDLANQLQSAALPTVVPSFASLPCTDCLLHLPLLLCCTPMIHLVFAAIVTDCAGVGAVSGRIAVTSTITTYPSSTGVACEGNHSKSCSFTCPPPPPPACVDPGRWEPWDTRSCAKAINSAELGFAEIRYNVPALSIEDPMYALAAGEDEMYMSTEWDSNTLCSLLESSAQSQQQGLAANSLGLSITSEADGAPLEQSRFVSELCVPAAPDSTETDEQNVAAVQRFSSPSSQMKRYVREIKCFPRCHDPGSTESTSALQGTFRRTFNWNHNSDAGKFGARRENPNSPYIDSMGYKCPPEDFTEDCTLEPCRVDCAYTWGPCVNATGSTDGCGSGTQSPVVSVSPNLLGVACPAPRTCQLPACDSDCEVSDWSAWSGCEGNCECNSDVAGDHKPDTAPVDPSFEFILNFNCGQYYSNQYSPNKAAKYLEKCGAQDCHQIQENVGCPYTDQNGFCYTESGIDYCNRVPSDQRCHTNKPPLYGTCPGADPKPKDPACFLLGFQTSSRTVLNAAVGSGTCLPLHRNKTCSLTPNECTVVDCAGEWQSDTCNQPCGEKAKYTKRFVMTQKPSVTGKPCPDPKELVDNDCAVVPCDTNCTMNDWGEWSTCRPVPAEQSKAAQEFTPSIDCPELQSQHCGRMTGFGCARGYDQCMWVVPTGATVGNCVARTSTLASTCTGTCTGGGVRNRTRNVLTAAVGGICWDTEQTEECLVACDCAGADPSHCLSL